MDDRLNDFFNESEKNSASIEDNSDPEAFPLRDLKSILLSIDWEISDEVLTMLIEEIGTLEDTYKNDKNLVVFFQLLGTVGKYIKKRKVNAHPGAIKLLNSVYNSLEIVLLSKGITEAEKKKILLVQVKEFKKIKEQIAHRKVDMTKRIAVEPSEKKKPKFEEQKKDVIVQVEPGPPEEARVELPRDISRMTPQEAFAYVLEEVKQVIRTEFKVLKEELKL
jgi:hypothetical protein